MASLHGLRSALQGLQAITPLARDRPRHAGLLADLEARIQAIEREQTEKDARDERASQRMDELCLSLISDGDPVVLLSSDGARFSANRGCLRRSEVFAAMLDSPCVEGQGGDITIDATREEVRGMVVALSLGPDFSRLFVLPSEGGALARLAELGTLWSIPGLTGAAISALSHSSWQADAVPSPFQFLDLADRHLATAHSPPDKQVWAGGREASLRAIIQNWDRALEMPEFTALTLPQLTELVGWVPGWASKKRVTVLYTHGHGYGSPAKPTKKFKFSNDTTVHVHHEGEVTVVVSHAHKWLCKIAVAVCQANAAPVRGPYHQSRSFRAFEADDLKGVDGSAGSSAVTLIVWQRQPALERQCRGIVKWAQGNGHSSASPGDGSFRVSVLSALSRRGVAPKLQKLLLEWTARAFKFLQEDAALLRLPAPLIKKVMEQDSLDTDGDEMKLVEFLVRWAQWKPVPALAPDARAPLPDAPGRSARLSQSADPLVPNEEAAEGAVEEEKGEVVVVKEEEEEEEEEGTSGRAAAMPELLKCVRMPYINTHAWHDHPQEFQYLSTRCPLFKSLFVEAEEVQKGKRPREALEGSEGRRRKRARYPELQPDSPESIFALLQTRSATP